MPNKGGAREGAGRPRQWINSIHPRKCITVPPTIADLAMQAARLIDAEDEEILELLKRKAQEK
jgi:hypothetical protein